MTLLKRFLDIGEHGSPASMAYSPPNPMSFNSPSVLPTTVEAAVVLTNTAASWSEECSVNTSREILNDMSFDDAENDDANVTVEQVSRLILHFL